jgi:hypothetical protein
MDEKRLSMEAAARLITEAKHMRYDFPFFYFYRYVRLCLVAFVVYYLDIKFKVEKGTSKGKKEKKGKAGPKQAVSCCFSYDTCSGDKWLLGASSGLCS